jgi:hypothetical protein
VRYKVNWDKGRDYIDNFIPFVGECLRLSSREEVSLGELQVSLRTNFGLKIPQGTLNTLLKRAERRGYLRHHEKVYHRNSEALSRLDLPRIRNDVLRQQDALVGKLASFCAEDFKIELSKVQAEAALLDYVKDFATPILGAALDGQPLPVARQSPKHAYFLVNAFIARLNESDPEGFRFLETIVKGSILANILLFPDLGGISQTFERVRVYFDTPFLLRALSFEGDSMQAPCRELLELLYEQNAELRCFQHTFDEMWRILDAAGHALRDPQGHRHTHGETLENFIRLRYTPSDVELAMGRLEQSLRALRIKVEPRPPQIESLGLDEKRFEGLLREKVHYHSEDALLHDLDSLTSIHRLRRGERYPRLESCVALFITTNANLALPSVPTSLRQF